MSDHRTSSSAPLRIAVLTTVWFEGSHTDVIVPRIMNGWSIDGERHTVDLEVAALFMEQVGCAHGPDVGTAFLDAHGIHRAVSIADALAAGGPPGVNVDGVLIVGEHGDYEVNEFGQQLYPRRRFFDAAIAVMETAGVFVPIFNDKGLSYSAVDANHMVETAQRTGVALAAGSTVPLSWRVPQGAELAAGASITEAVLVGWGPLERYGYHCIEALQAHVERRRGGETGVRRVQAYDAETARRYLNDGTVNPALLAVAMEQFGFDAAQGDRALASVHGLIQLQYLDGLRAWVVICEEEVRQFAIACGGEQAQFSCLMWLPGAPHAHFTFLVRQIDILVRTGRAEIPVQRTQLSTGVLDAAMRSWATGEQVLTPELAITYAPRLSVDGTAVHLPMLTSAEG